MSLAAQELRGLVPEAARHPFGCRVLERLLEHCSSQQKEAILQEVLSRGRKGFNPLPYIYISISSTYSPSGIGWCRLPGFEDRVWWF